ncbi:MAG TPA: SLC45 family MFS transporter [Dehalococcoidia bacterium]|nr:SLC45 family MFS transporter [Dehalococcoidia bacterium]
MGENGNTFGRLDYLKITILGFALAGLAGSMNSIILPVRLLDFLDESQKNSYLGLVTFAGLILAMIIQPVIGAFSDRCHISWGRRRPFILAGVILVILFLPGIGLAGSLSLFFFVYCMLQVSSNTAQAPFQALIPDLTPPDKRGRASGVKNVVEILGGLAVMRLAAYLMGQYQEYARVSWLWMTQGVLAAVFLVTGLFTILKVKEVRVSESRGKSISSIFKSLKIDLKHRDFGWFLASRSVLGIPGVVLQIFTLYYLMDYIKIDDPTAVAGDLMVVVGISLLAMVYPAGWLTDRIGRRPVVIFSGLLAALGIVFLCFSHSYLSLMLSGAVIGIANGIMLSSTWALATDLTARGEEGRYLGVTNIALAGGSALARLVGPVIDFFNNINSGLGYQVMLFICFASFIVGVLLILKVKQDGSH